VNFHLSPKALLILKEGRCEAETDLRRLSRTRFAQRLTDYRYNVELADIDGRATI
jgi:hypothetical protein